MKRIFVLLFFFTFALRALDDFTVHIKNTGAQDIFFNVNCPASGVSSSSITAEVAVGGEIIKPISTSNTNHYVIKPGVTFRVSIKPYCNDNGIFMRIFGPLVGDLELNLSICPEEDFSEENAIEVWWDGTRMMHKGGREGRTNLPCKEVVGSIINRAT